MVDVKKTAPNDELDNQEKEKGFAFEELQTLSKRISDSADMPLGLKDRVDQMLGRLGIMAKFGYYAREFDTLSRYVDVVTSIPWGRQTQDKLGLEHARELLDQTHFGMDYVKERILEYLAMLSLLRQRKEKEAISQSPILLFVGLQGVGKTTLAASIAQALERKFHRVAMGGIGSVLEIRGKSKSFPQAEPGQIVKALVKTQVMNPVILLDEIDKVSGDVGVRADVMATLLEILDPNQNNEFRDHYVDYPMDLSQILFICSANNVGTLSTALMDRLEVIKMPAYTDQEKITIARDYLLPKVIAKSGLKHEELQIDPELWPAIVRPFGFDTGIRSLGRTLEAMSRKVAKEIVEGKSAQVFVNEENLKHYLPK